MTLTTRSQLSSRKITNSISGRTSGHNGSEMAIQAIEQGKEISRHMKTTVDLTSSTMAGTITTMIGEEVTIEASTMVALSHKTSRMTTIEMAIIISITRIWSSHKKVAIMISSIQLTQRIKPVITTITTLNAG